MKCEYYKKYIKSKFNLVMALCLMLLVVLSYYSTYTDYTELQMQLANPSQDFNVQVAQKLAEGYNGLTYLGNFFFSTDYYIISCICLLICFSVVIGDEMHNNLKNGFGNWLVLRCNYKKYLHDILLSQGAYIATFIVVFFLVLVVISFLLFPVNFTHGMTVSTVSDIHSGTVVLYLIAQLLGLIFYMCAVFVICSMSTVYVKNKYFLQLIPLIVYFIPNFMASTLGNLSSWSADFFGYLNSDHFLTFPNLFLSADLLIIEKIYLLVCVPIFLGVIIVFIYRKNCKKYKKEYLW